jgi:hypothetical protein
MSYLIRFVQIVYQLCPRDSRADSMRAVGIIPRFKDIDNSSVLPHFREVKRTALKISARRDTPRCGRCLKALFGIPFCPGALLNLSPWWLHEPRRGRLIRFPGRGEEEDLSETSTNSITNGTNDRSPAATMCPDCRQGILRDWESKPPGWSTGRRSRKSRYQFGHPPHMSSGTRDSIAEPHWSIIHSLSPQFTDFCSRLISAAEISLFQNARRYQRPGVVTRETLGSRCCQSIQNGSGEVLNPRIDCHRVV